jgi:hypothetical protein
MPAACTVARRLLVPPVVVLVLSTLAMASSSIQVKVHFVQPLTLPGVTEMQLLTALQADLNDEFGTAGITFTVQESSINYGELAHGAAQNLSDAVGYTAARENVRNILLATPDAMDYLDPADLPPDVASAVQALNTTQAAFQTQFAAATNLAGVPSGTIAFVVTPAVVDGGMAKVGERWCELRAGQIPLLFPTPVELTSGSMGINIDFMAPAFDPYRAGYDDARRSAYELQHLLNNAKHNLGRIFGRPTNSGSLSDAMREGLDYQAAQHFIRSGSPVHYSPGDRSAIASTLTSLLQAAQKGARQ